MSRLFFFPQRLVQGNLLMQCDSGCVSFQNSAEIKKQFPNGSDQLFTGDGLTNLFNCFAFFNSHKKIKQNENTKNILHAGVHDLNFC